LRKGPWEEYGGGVVIVKDSGCLLPRAKMHMCILGAFTHDIVWKGEANPRPRHATLVPAEDQPFAG
jgi:hypothetical protein